MHGDGVIAKNNRGLSPNFNWKYCSIAFRFLDTDLIKVCIFRKRKQIYFIYIVSPEKNDMILNQETIVGYRFGIP